jgi:hypothetical protein
MSIETFDMRTFVNRDGEIALFEEMLSLNTDRRLLAIRDKQGTGKSHLLLKFHSLCRIPQFRVPVSLVASDQLSDKSPFGIVEIMAKDLQRRGIDLTVFNTFNRARLAEDFSFFTSVRAQLDIHGSSFENASDVRIASIIVEYAKEVNLQPTNFTSDMRKNVREWCIQAFFADLRRICTQRPVVLMIDTIDNDQERCPPLIWQWIHNDLFDQYLYRSPDEDLHLILILAGRDVRLPDESEIQYFEQLISLSNWSRLHIEAYLQARDFTYSRDQVDVFEAMALQRIPPKVIVDAIESIYLRGL